MERHHHRLEGLTSRGSVLRLSALPALFLAIFFLWPVFNLLARGLGDNPAAITDVFTSSSIRSAAWFTLWQATVSTIATVIVGLPLAAVVANFEFPGRRLVTALVTLPFVLPTVVVAGAFLTTGDRLGLTTGTFSLSRTPFAILAAHVFFNVAVVVRTVGGFWSQLSRDDEHAARTLGTTWARTFWRITLRRLRPALLAASSIVFLFTFTSFGIVLILGGARERTIETEIFRFAISRTDFATAAVLSILQLLVVVLLVAANLRLRTQLRRGDRLSSDRRRPIGSVSDAALVGVTVLVTLLFLMTPIVLLVVESLRSGGGFGFGNYRRLTERPPFLTVSPLRATFNSIGFALVATTIATIVGGWASIALSLIHIPSPRDRQKSRMPSSA